MAKYFFQLVFSLLLTFSILAPTVLALIDQEQESGLVLESKEGENKDTEKKYDEKQLFLESTVTYASALFREENHLKNIDPLNYQGVDFDILLPPPKGRIA